MSLQMLNSEGERYYGPAVSFNTSSSISPSRSIYSSISFGLWRRLQSKQRLKNNKFQAPNNNACPSLFDGKITMTNDQNHKQKEYCLEFEICYLIYPSKSEGQALEFVFCDL
jgi:hypothetical protein